MKPAFGKKAAITCAAIHGSVATARDSDGREESSTDYTDYTDSEKPKQQTIRGMIVDAGASLHRLWASSFVFSCIFAPGSYLCNLCNLCNLWTCPLFSQKTPPLSSCSDQIPIRQTLKFSG